MSQLVPRVGCALAAVVAIGVAPVAPDLSGGTAHAAGGDPDAGGAGAGEREADAGTLEAAPADDASDRDATAARTDGGGREAGPAADGAGAGRDRGPGGDAGDGSAAERAAERVRSMVMSLRGHGSPDPRRVRNVAKEMAGAGEPARSALVELLDDEDVGVRWAAALALGRLGVGEARAPVIARLGDPSPRVAAAAAGALVDDEATWTMKALVRWIGHPDEEVRKAVREALQGRSPEAVRPLIRTYLEHPPDGVGRGPYLALLGHYPGDDTARRLVDALADEALVDPALRGLEAMGERSAEQLADWIVARASDRAETAKRALGALASMGAGARDVLERHLPQLSLACVRHALRRVLEAAPAEEGAERIEGLTGSRDPEVRRAALELVPEVDGADPSRHLAASLRRDEAAVRLAAARSVRGAERSGQLAEILMRRYRELARERSEGNLEERRTLLRSLGYVGRDDAVAELVQATGHDGEREAALDGLERMGERAVGALVFVIKSGDPTRIPTAVEALSRLGSPAVEPLLELLQHRSRQVRNTARRALARVEAASAVPRVVELIERGSTPGRPQLVALLGQIYGDRSFRALRRLARESKKAPVRRAAVEALAVQDDERVLAVLRERAVEDRRDEVRLSAVRGLVWQGDRGAVDTLLEVLEEDREVPVRDEAARALGYLAGPDRVSALLERMDTPRTEVRIAVRDALRRVTFQRHLDEASTFRRWYRTWDGGGSDAELDEGHVKLGDGVSLRYLVGGSGEPLLVLPGGPDLSHAYLRPGLDPLLASRRLLYVDLPGRGASERPDEGTLGLEYDVSASLELLDRLNLDEAEVDVYAHGWGGLVAARLAEEHPDRIGRLVLDNVPMPTRAGWKARMERARAEVPSPWEGDLAWLRSEDARFRSRVRDRFLYRALMTGQVAQVSALVGVARKLRTNPSVRSAIVTPLGNFDLRPTFDRLEVPTLLLHGDASPLPEEGWTWREELADGKERVQGRVIEEAGLLPCYERPKRWRRIVDAFLRGPEE